MAELRNRLRLFSGLVLLTFVVGHFLNHSLGLVSVELMESATAVFTDPWRTLPGTVLFLGAMVIHMGVAIHSLWRRRTLRMRGWEAAQAILGFTAPILLAAHLAATRGLVEVSESKSGYAWTLAIFWSANPTRGVLQAAAVLVVWVHACIGLHTWLRLKPGYETWRPAALAGAVTLPLLALAGYVAAGARIRSRASDDYWKDNAAYYANFEAWMPGFVADVETTVWTVLAGILAMLLAGRWLRSAAKARSRKPKFLYAPGDVRGDLVAGATLLETLRDAGIDHASVCGGRGRCSTCRVRITGGLENLPPADEDEKKVLSRITESPAVRLACQIRPTAEIVVSALVRADAAAGKPAPRRGYRQGREMTAAFLFVDLRGSTRLCEERLPYDVVFVLNQFFAELAEALSETEGHYAQFNGDGLMAIYGLEGSAERGARQALEGAKAMFRRLAALNERLEEELGDDLKIGIGIHTGVAIVGSMGPPQSPIVSALGDTVNIAARLESQTKEFGVPLVVSAETAERGGVDLSGFERHAIQVKGRDRAIEVFAVDDPEKMPAALA